MTEIRVFSNDEFELHVTPSETSFTIAAPGLARSLGFRDAARMVESVPDDEKGYTLSCTPGGDQRIWFLFEPGFYRVLGQRQAARIKNPNIRAQVERFQHWVYHEVLPSIRQTGGYQLPRSHESQAGFGISVFQPDFFTYDEVCALLRQMFGISLTVNELTRILRAGGVLKQNGAPTKKHWDWFWFTNSAWNLQSQVIPRVAFKVYETGREMQDWRFLQARLQLDGVGQPPARLSQHERYQVGP